MDTANGSLDPNAALQAWPIDSADDDVVLAEAWHALSHFANDWDIRQKDAAYDELMRAQLFQHARKIKVQFNL